MEPSGPDRPPDRTAPRSERAPHAAAAAEGRRDAMNRNEWARTPMRPLQASALGPVQTAARNEPVPRLACRARPTRDPRLFVPCRAGTALEPSGVRQLLRSHRGADLELQDVADAVGNVLVKLGPGWGCRRPDNVQNRSWGDRRVHPLGRRPWSGGLTPPACPQRPRRSARPRRWLRLLRAAGQLRRRSRSLRAGPGGVAPR